MIATADKDTLTIILLRKILDVVKESGANVTEANCALTAAAALVPDLNLQVKPTREIHLDRLPGTAPR